MILINLMFSCDFNNDGVENDNNGKKSLCNSMITTLQLLMFCFISFMVVIWVGDDNTNKAEKKRKDPKASLCMESVMMIILII